MEEEDSVGKGCVRKMRGGGRKSFLRLSVEEKKGITNPCEDSISLNERKKGGP